MSDTLIICDTERPYTTLYSAGGSAVLISTVGLLLEVFFVERCDGMSQYFSFAYIQFD
jgi:hypothetical protein